jgi:hypothetical protein
MVRLSCEIVSEIATRYQFHGLGFIVIIGKHFVKFYVLNYCFRMTKIGHSLVRLVFRVLSSMFQMFSTTLNHVVAYLLVVVNNLRYLHNLTILDLT